MGFMHIHVCMHACVMHMSDVCVHACVMHMEMMMEMEMEMEVGW